MKKFTVHTKRNQENLHQNRRIEESNLQKL